MRIAEVSTNSFVGKVLRFPLRFVPGEMPILRGKSRGKKWIVSSASHGLWLGLFEPQERLAFENTVPKGGTIFDVGANVGFYAVLGSVLAGDEGRVVAFEPLPRNLSYLKRHLELNQITNVTVIEAAVAERCGTANFEHSPNPSMSHISSQGRIEVKVVSLDEIISRGEVPLPDYIKIDVEGAEFSVLSGAMSTLREYHPPLLLATHGRNLHEQCCECLSSLGYGIKVLLENHKAGDQMRGELLAQAKPSNNRQVKDHAAA
jgi:FkbM family methyltransferase